MATVAVYIEAFAHYAEAMHLPRTLVTRYPMGRPLGPPGHTSTQRAVLEAALGMIDDAGGPGSIRRFEGAYRPGTPRS